MISSSQVAIMAEKEEGSQNLPQCIATESGSISQILIFFLGKYRLLNMINKINKSQIIIKTEL